jgi:hypothetical protein
MTWATRIVQKPSWPARPPLTNIESSEEPITISGVAIGRKISTFAEPRPRNRCRTIANAISVPSRVAPRVASAAIVIDCTTESHMPTGSHMWVQLSRVSPSNW